MTSGRRPPRRRSILRPTLATAGIVVLGLSAHAGAGGTLPPPDVLLGLVVLVGAASAALHLRVLRLVVAAPLAVAAQVALHAAGTTAGAVHDHAGPAGADDHMLLAHTVSAALTMLALVWQDQAVQAVRAVVQLLEPLVRTVVAGPRRPAPAQPRSPLPLGRERVHLAPHRGPPLLPAFAAS